MSVYDGCLASPRFQANGEDTTCAPRGERKVSSYEGEEVAMARNIISKRSPQMPVGTEVAAFRTHEEATKAVEKLAEEQFPLPSVTIVGSDLHLAERIIGRMTPAKVAMAGATQGLTWGLMMAVFSILFYPQANAALPVVLIVTGILIGVLVTTVAWALSKSRGSFAVQTSMVASRYAVLVSEMPDKAFTLLAHQPGNLAASPRRPVRRSEPVHTREVDSYSAETEKIGEDERWTAVAVEEEVVSAPSKPTEYGSRPDEAPRFGVRLSDRDPSAHSDDDSDPS